MDVALLRSFLDDIKANPLDDTPRLVLADWLQENGDTEADRARGEFIRYMVRARSRPSWSDPGLEGASGVWDAHVAEWRKPIVVHPRLSAFSEDGLMVVEGSPAALLSRAVRAAAATPAWDWVDTIALNGGSRKLADVLNRPLFAGVRRLRLGINFGKLPAILEALVTSSHLDSLRSVHFGRQHLEKPDLEKLANWPGLPRLADLDMGLSEDAGPAFAHLPLSGLRSLLLNLLFANRGTLANVLQSPHLPGVRTFCICCVKAEMTAFVGATDGRVFRDLASLDLSQSYVEDEGATILARVDFPALRSLRLSSCHIREEGVRALARAPWLAGLERLHLNANDLSSGTVDLLAAPLTSLRWLDLAGAQVTPEGLAALTASPHLQKLEILSLAGHELGNAMGTLLAASDTLPALRVLDLYDTGFTGEGLRALTRWPGLARLEALNLSPVTADEDGLSALQASPHYNPRMRFAVAGLPWSPTEE
jgi:uncharacterized protein (TIGR02996 family)